MVLEEQHFHLAKDFSDFSTFFIEHLSKAIPIIQSVTMSVSWAFTWVGKRKRDSATLWRTGRPCPFTLTVSFPSPPPGSVGTPGEPSWSISLTQGWLRSTWKSAEILQPLDRSNNARVMKNGSTWGETENLGMSLHHVLLCLTYLTSF